MKHGIKYLVMSRLVAIVVLVLVAFALILNYSFSFVLRSNLSSNGSQHAQKNVTQIENALEDIYMMGEYLSLNSDVRNFLQKTEYDSASEHVRDIYRLMNGLKSAFTPKKYVHTFCIVARDGTAYWSRCPYDQFFMDWFAEHSGLQQRLPAQFLGFTGSYPLPTYNSFNSYDLVVSCVFNVYRTEQGVPSSNEQIVVNLNLDLLMKDVLSSSSLFDQIGIVDAHGDLIYLSGGDIDRFLAAAGQLELGMTQLGEDYYFTNEVPSTGWQVISVFDDRQMQQMVDLPFLYILVTIIITALMMIFAFVFPLLLRISREIVALDSAIDQVADGDLDASVYLSATRELENISGGFNRMVINTRHYMKASLDNLREKQKLHFDLLLARINPHFIYNTLNSVIYLARKDKSREIIELTGAFITLLQDSIHTRKNTMFERVSTELNVLDQYIIIQNYRYAGRFLYRSEVAPHLQDAYIPKNILQPLIENAIVHGMCMKTEPGTVRLVMAQADGAVQITIEDDGVGMDAEKARRVLLPDTDTPNHGPAKVRSIAISNIAQRLEYLFPGGARFAIDSEPGRGTCIRIEVPLLTEPPVE